MTNLNNLSSTSVSDHLSRDAKPVLWPAPLRLTINAFKERLHESLRRETLNFPTVQVGKHRHVYVCGDPGCCVYFIQSGQIKLLMLSPEGKECLLAIHTPGDTFGELGLTGSSPRQETATAMEDTTLKRIPCAQFFLHLTNNSLIEGFVQYLATRVGDQQQVISNLITVDSEHRLGETLLLLAHKLGRPDPRSTRIEQKITHEELSAMVGTTRPRITAFMLKFSGLGLIEMSPERFLIIKETKLADYLARLR
jgi:CRP/FNR family cyclic AMP-dependent transcriptional regulator